MAFLQRLLYLPNEVHEGDQIGPRAVFEGMLANNELGAYHAFSFLTKANQQKSHSVVFEQLLAEAERFKPDTILWQHPSHFNVTIEQLHRLKAIECRPILAYDERDLYGDKTKPLTDGARSLAIAADIVFIVGLGSYAALMAEAGAKNICYSPNCVDTIRFGHPWEPTLEREYDVIMIGNLVRGSWRSSGLPGWRNRYALAERLEQIFKGKFALYGGGWKNLPCKGALSFTQQEQAIRQAWLSVGWNYYDSTPYYFSNRTPIAMMSGVVHVKNYQPGYENIFRDGEVIWFGRDVEEVVDVIRYLLSLPKHKLIEYGIKGQQYARNNLTADIVFRDIITQIKDVHSSRM
jgi:hypothetical protein